MSIIERIIVAEFANPLSDRPGVTGWQDAQRIVLGRTVYAIAIAPDSEVDLVYLYPRKVGGIDFANRIAIAPGAPYIGRLDPTEVPELYAVPVRAADFPSATVLLGGMSATEFPRLKLDLYTEEAPLLAPPLRADFEYSAAGNINTPAANPAVSFAFPLMGRREFWVNWTPSNYAGPFSVVPSFALYTFAASAALGISSMPWVPTGLSTVGTGVTGQEHFTPAGAVSGGTRNDWSGAATVGVFTLTGDAFGSFDYKVTVGGRDGR